MHDKSNQNAKMVENFLGELMKSTEESINDLFTSRKDARKGALANLTPALRLVAAFAIIISTGTLLLLIPWAVPTDQPLSLVDALFTATSAVCVTGLIVRDTAMAFTPFGQVIILLLIQVGGLGYMIMASMAAILLGRRIGVSDKVAIRQALNLDTGEGMLKFVRNAVLVTLSLEFIGAIIITATYWGDHSPGRAIVLGVFHAISGFNNAGFCLFSDNLMSQGNHTLVVATISFLAILGGLGYMVIHELLYWHKKERKKLSVHARLVLITTSALVVIGALVFYFTADMDWGQALFLSAVGRTSGFNIQDTGALAPRVQFFMTPLMFIGASPGGTGGGIKTTTFAIMCLAIWATLRGRNEIVVFRRHLSQNIIYKSLIIFLIMSVFLVVFTLLLEIMENLDVGKILFEMTSAFGTVGLSMGDGGNLSMSALFSTSGKLLVTAAMFFGRLGPITIGLAAALYTRNSHMKYPEGKVSIG